MKKVKQLVAELVVAIMAVVPSAAHAADWGCEVLLCLANPAGPMAASYCVPPIQRLFASLLKRFPDPFPQCGMAQGSLGGGAFARPENMYYDVCPGGTTAAPAGQRVVMAPSMDAVNGVPRWDMSSIGLGIGESVPENRDEDGNLMMPPKVCVGRAVGTTPVLVLVSNGEDSNYTISLDVAVYSQVVYLDPNTASPRAINVYINDQLFRTVRY